MFKKAISWLLILALLCSCSWISVFAEGEPTTDTEAAAQGYHFKVTKDGSFVRYGKLTDGKDFSGVEDGSVITLIADFGTNADDPDQAAKTLIYLNGKYTLDGANHTVNAVIRSDATANVTVRNVNFRVVLGTFGNFYQINKDNTCVFDTCSFDIKGTPAYGLLIARGNMTLKDSTFKYTSDSDKNVFFQDGGDKGATIINTTFDLTSAPNAKVGLYFGINHHYYTSTSFKTVHGWAQAGDTISLFTDWTIPKIETDDNERFVIKKAITLDGNGHTLSTNTTTYPLRVDVSGVTIRNLNVVQNGEGAAFQVNAGASVTVENSTIRCTNKTPYGAVIVNGDLTLGNGAKVIADGETDDGTKSVGVRMNASNATLTVNEGAEITTVGNTFKANAVSTITVNGGTITTARHMWEANAAGYTLTINGGTFVSTASDSMICLYGSKAPTVNLLGGTFTAAQIVSHENLLTSFNGNITWRKPDGTLIWRGPNADEFKNHDATLLLPGGNVATKENSGIRFTTVVDKAWYDEMVAAGVTVKKTGTLIAPKKYVDRVNGEFTAEALKDLSFVDIENYGWYNQKTAEKENRYFYYGNLIELQPESITGELSGIGYMVVEVAGLGTFTLYGTQMNGVVKDIAAGLTGNDAAQNAVLEFFRGNEG